MVRYYKRRPTRTNRGRARALALRRSRRNALVTSRRTIRRIANRPTFSGRPKGGLVKMRYCETVVLNAGTAGTAGYVFRANSIFDPNQSGVGYQPLSHDQWALFYNHYRVYGAKITVKFSAANAAAPMVAGIYLNDDLTAPAAGQYTDYIEHGKGRWKLMDDSGGPANRTITLKYSAKRFHNCTNVKDRTDLKATFGTNPAEEAFFFIWAASQEAATDPGPVYATVMIDYIVGLEEPKDLPAS